MQTTTPKELVYHATDNQAFEICVHADAARALLFLLGTALEASAEPTKEEREGMMMLVSSVGRNLSDAINPVFRSNTASETFSQNVA